MHILESVLNTTVGCDICIEGPSQVNILTVEATLSEIREGNIAVALVVNATGGPVKLRQGVFLSRALAFDKQVVPEPLDLPTGFVSSVTPSSSNSNLAQTQTRDSLMGAFVVLGQNKWPPVPPICVRVFCPGVLQLFQMLYVGKTPELTSQRNGGSLSPFARIVF
ncbi:hypothetical protein GWK47_014206 [Chionoecetes opilio]|uniref:Uncharacterized protein n=1 Tax=Chionoecetes opilio TaxID=41210 RepID=A0A8J5CIY5_CHIOP|nr:hypothetical protein GWK47_014206 [Chionoecetes opilio]